MPLLRRFSISVRFQFSHFYTKKMHFWHLFLGSTYYMLCTAECNSQLNWIDIRNSELKIYHSKFLPEIYSTHQINKNRKKTAPKKRWLRRKVFWSWLVFLVNFSIWSKWYNISSTDLIWRPIFYSIRLKMSNKKIFQIPKIGQNSWGRNQIKTIWGYGSWIY